MSNERLFLLILWALAIITFALGWKILDTKHTLQRDLLEHSWSLSIWSLECRVDDLEEQKDELAVEIEGLKERLKKLEERG